MELKMSSLLGVFLGFLLGLISSHSLEWVRGIRAFNVICTEFEITRKRLSEQLSSINKETDRRRKLNFLSESPIQRTTAWTNFSASLPSVISSDDLIIIYKLWDEIDFANSIHKYLKEHNIWNTEYDQKLDVYREHWEKVASEILNMPLPEQKTLIGYIIGQLKQLVTRIWLRFGYRITSKT
jgi:hypothetical protein